VAISSSPSDYTKTANGVNYSLGYGYYTDIGAIADLLQIPPFSVSTNPTAAQVGAIIKRVEGTVDDKAKRSFRPIIHKDEVHNFEVSRPPIKAYYGGYIGFVQLGTMKLSKVISLRVWQGDSYKEIASAHGSIQLLDNFRDIYQIKLGLPNSGTTFTLTADTTTIGNDEFDVSLGKKTTAKEIQYCINELFPADTFQFTGATQPKSIAGDSPDTSKNISDFFYAYADDSTSTKIQISSLLMGEDGSDCDIVITTQQTCSGSNASTNLTVEDSSKLAVGMGVSGTDIPSAATIASITDATTVVLSTTITGDGLSSETVTFTATNLSIPTVATVERFTDKQDLRRLGSFWTIGDEGRIFFLKDYPYHTNNSVIVTYVAGSSRVPAAIHEAATKLAAAEILRHDDQTILIAETGANISTKEKYDILRKEGMDILSSKSDIVYFLD
jgi:hypothetical protein